MDLTITTASEELADVDGGPLDEERCSSFSYIKQGLIKNPNGLATIAMHQDANHLSELVTTDDVSSKAINPTGCLQWTYTQLHQAALKFAAGLMAHGVQPGMKIATLIPNRVEYPLTLWMYSLLRLTLIPLDPGAVQPLRRAELTTFMESLSPDIVMVLDKDGANAIDEVVSIHSPPKIKILLEGTAPGWTTILDLTADGVRASIDTDRLVKDAEGPDDPDRISLILFTSGTSTGTPKGCMRHVGSVNHLFYNKYQWGQGFNERSRVLTSTANFRVISPALHGNIWHNGATAIMPDPSLGPKGVIAAIREFRLTFLLFIPALMYAVISDSSFADLDVSSVTDITLGGDMITRDLHVRTRKAFPYAKVATSHGMTEGAGLFRWPFLETPFDQIPFFGEISPLGQASPGSKLRIRDAESGRTMKRNEAGELCVSSGSVIKHYLGNINQEAFFHDNETQWFRTGDLAMIDGDGNVYILGRIKDVIMRSGIPITPAALESCIEKFTGSQTSVIAWPHPVLGQEPLVILKASNGKTEGQIRQQVLDMFGQDYALGPVLTLQQLGIEEFPVNASGKIQKREMLGLVNEYYSKRSRI